eukprot:CAMPEP_0203643126 /NCGR_PEP_ID=MMETSP0088-20131115/8564_1 /ASSEMBLY_ACC=CAM_ASM_001087 /TAXON_ID=426623 /ORGANISM="Chaetoceros affinis, Strain CCMP159" /LENGTH=238 /DNA_ID=CAMNT_0050499213 /DNA_START=22 /DNA_END=738 /DNA_ORIENTATION=+
MKPTTYIFTALHLIASVGAFTVNQLSLPIRRTQLGAAPSSVEELISMPETWGPIKQELDHVPVFSCANDQGQPLQYNLGGKPVAFFFLDIDAAKDELEKAKTEAKLEGLSLLPFPLGEIFEMGAKQMAVIIPSSSALNAAGAPPGMNPIGQQVPLFGCMEIAATQPDGTSMTPMFFSQDEAESAMNMALSEAGGGDSSKFKVNVVPLVQAVQLGATNKEKTFIFEAPKSSLEYLRSIQ